jgi:hypothetical protein
MSKANEQLADTRRTIDRPSAAGIVLIINEFSGTIVTGAKVRGDGDF